MYALLSSLVFVAPLTSLKGGLPMGYRFFPVRSMIPSLRDVQLLDVLNSHFQTVFGISKLQSTLLQLAYFVSFNSRFVDRTSELKVIHQGAYFLWSPWAGVIVRAFFP